ncbi:MAG: hypothetical protein JST00_01595 [Deltaproteobacteria bacterium]|nr:hypothetical protein [Deltaproteobacteria bacterium]
MSAAKREDKSEKTWLLTGPWAGAWKIFAGIGAVGVLGAGAGFATDPRRFAFSWLFAFVAVLAIALGSLFFVIIQRLTSAGWSVTVRRTAEFFASGLVVMIPLFLPVIVSMGHLFPWLGGHGEAHGPAAGGEHHGAITVPFVKDAHAQPAAPHEGAPAQAAPHGATPPEHGAQAPAAGHDAHGGAPAAGHGGGHGPAEAALHQAHAKIHHETMAKKSGYLNKNFFLARVVFYFAVWVIVAMRMFGFSTQQDSSKDPNLTLKAQSFAPIATFLFGISLTFAAFDWIMSLEPTWFSTIFGVFYFACGVVSSYAMLILVTLALRSSGPLKGAVTNEHFHDLGKLMFGFNVFWAYIGFSQFMLIWYAALPEETTFYHNRWDVGPWSTVSLAIIFGHFVIPFFLTISRNWKRNTDRLRIGAAIIFVMHFVDCYWLVMPNYLLGKDGFTFHWMDLMCLLAVGGVYGAYVFFRMTKFPLVPIGDPRLQRSLHFQNA